ncbi:DUF418 domain-containing protein [Brevibacillus sp. TJ4]|uniref:DUF418 domain-containing protein n=1 Tax=Brevibacillus sp. TJ4 TaxID=3234853 RepID=UPI003BA00CB8
MKIAPVSEADRIRQLDIIRGFALFGILLVNMPSYLHPALFTTVAGLPVDHTPLDEWIRLLFDMFVQTKFYTIFSFLFGVGFYVFMSRAEQKGLPMNQLFLRRLMVLLLIGMLHMFLLWYGDILHTYAIAGFFLMLFYKKKKATVHRWAWTLLIIMQTLLGLTLLIPGSLAGTRSALAQQAIEVYNNGSWGEWMQFRWLHEIPFVMGNELFALLSVMPLLLFGFSAAREGVFSRTAEHRAAIWRVWRISLIASIPLVAMIPLVKYEVVRFPAAPELAIQVFVNWSGLALCAFYITSLLLLLAKESWLNRLAGLALVGRMSLTQYLLQTVLFVSITRLFSLYGSVSLVWGVLSCIVLFGCQVAFSRWWLERYSYGPLEWVWRCCTYAAIVPLKRE